MKKMRQNQMGGIAVRIEFLSLGIDAAARRIILKLGPYSLLTFHAVSMDMVRVLMRNEEIELNLKEQSVKRIQLRSSIQDAASLRPAVIG